MPEATTTYAPGSLVRARGRDWIVESDSTSDMLHLRPLAGDALKSCWLLPGLEQPEDAPAPATFPLPEEQDRGNSQEIRLLQSAMRLRLRSGAGPFRSFGNIAVQPRVYQLAPLLLALRQQTIRLLIADDVGVGKTIEAGLIVREMLDRGEISRFSVLCPPNLAVQWQSELWERFHIKAELIAPSTVGRLERQAPTGQSLFEHFPVSIISLDYIKSDRHRDSFLNNAPELIVVDEAHTCTASDNKVVQQRYHLLRALADNPQRHLLLLTATPHSGIKTGFYRLLGLLDRQFEELADATQRQRASLRDKLSRHLVQRRRNDIQKLWNESGVLPKRVATDALYSLSGPVLDFFEEVRRYCAQEARRSDKRMVWYAMLALLRCVSSSPASALSALEARSRGLSLEVDAEAECLNELSDGTGEDSPGDEELPVPEGAEESLRNLLRHAQRLCDSPASDPKLNQLVKIVKTLVKEGFSPIVFCQYISTARYVAKELVRVFPKHRVTAVTGQMPPAEREDAVQELFEAERRILVATNCLSEGINLQNGFSAVVHYDLAWNPTRHEQREGRVDRFGQSAPEVRCVMLYSHNNPVDAFILRVILRKAVVIRDELGVQVPVPCDETALGDAMVRALLLGNTRPVDSLLSSSQPMLPGMEDFSDELMLGDTLPAPANQRMTTFAQRSLQLAEVMPEYERCRRFLGSTDELREFLREACARLGAPLEPVGPPADDAWSLRLANLPDTVQRRLDAELRGDRYAPAKQPAWRFSLRTEGSPWPVVTRTHPLVATLADFLTELALDGPASARFTPAHRLPRWSAIVADVPRVTTLYHLRLRHMLTTAFGQKKRNILVEELQTLIGEGSAPLRPVEEAELARFTGLPAKGNMPEPLARKLFSRALEQWQQTDHEPFLRQRAETLEQDHQRVRAASRATAGSLSVQCCGAPDLLSVAIFRPAL